MTKIVHNKLLGGWFVVRGSHHTPIGGRFETKAEAEAWLKRKGGIDVRHREYLAAIERDHDRRRRFAVPADLAIPAFLRRRKLTATEYALSWAEIEGWFEEGRR